MSQGYNNNGTVQLHMKRKASYAAAAMPMRIYVNNCEVGKLKIGGTMDITIPADRPSMIKVSMVGNSMNVHKIEHQEMVYPQNAPSGHIQLEFKVKMNWAGVFTYGLAKPIGDVVYDVKYF